MPDLIHGDDAMRRSRSSDERAMLEVVLTKRFSSIRVYDAGQWIRKSTMTCASRRGHLARLSEESRSERGHDSVSALKSDDWTAVPDKSR